MSSTFDDAAWPTNAIPREWIDSLWQRMLAYYGHKFSDQWRGIDAECVKRTWAAELGKLNPIELKTGVLALGGAEWPPTLPQFIALCRPAIEPIKAYYEAVSGLQDRAQGKIGHWSHPAIFWAASGMAYELRTYGYAQVSARWEQALQAELAKGAWEPIEAPATTFIAHDTKRNLKATVQAREHARRMVARKDDRSFDHKRWARRILEHAQKPNHGLTPVVIDMARYALKNSEDD